MIEPESREPEFWWFILFEYYGNAILRREWFVLFKHLVPAAVGIAVSEYVIRQMSMPIWVTVILHLIIIILVQIIGTLFYRNWRHVKQNRFLFMCDFLWGIQVRVFWIPLIAEAAPAFWRLLNLQS